MATKRRASKRRATTKRRNPVTAAPAINPRRRRTRRRTTAVARRRNPAPLMANGRRRTRRTRRRNPAMVNPNVGGIMKFAIAAAVGGVGSSLIQQAVRALPIPQTGPIGMLAQVGLGFLAAYALPKTGIVKPETAATIGTVIAGSGVAQYFGSLFDLGSFLPALGNGVNDVQYIRNGQWPFGRQGFAPPNGLNDVQYIQNGEWPFGQTGFAPINGIATQPYV